MHTYQKHIISHPSYYTEGRRERQQVPFTHSLYVHNDVLVNDVYHGRSERLALRFLTV